MSRVTGGPPPSDWNKLQKLVWTMLAHGNTPENLNLTELAKHNAWTSADELLVEFRIQQNGDHKLPEEEAAATTEPPPSEPVEEIDE